MTTAKEHGHTVLAGVLPNRADRLEEVFKEVTADYFVDPLQRKLFLFLEYYFQKTSGGVLSKIALQDLLSRSSADPGKRALYEEFYEELSSGSVGDADFIWSIHELRELYAEQKTKEALTESMEIIVKGKESANGELIKGQEAARLHLLDTLADLDSSLTSQDAPHGDMRDEASLILAEYAERRKAKEENKQTGVLFGITELDNKVGGLQPGELILSAGFSSDGKTSLCVQLAWSAAIEQGKNVLFLSTETVNTVIRRKLVARHSKHSKFSTWGLPEGLNSKLMKTGGLNAHEEEFLEAVVQDFTQAKDYGHMYIHQVPRMASMSVIEQIMAGVQKKFNIDLVVCDYLALLRPALSRNNDRESLSNILKDSKQIATTFNKGNGVPFISPWQVNRASKEAADQIGRYTSQSLAETAEATNTPDVIVSILAPVDNTNRYADITGQVLKNRDGETADGLLMEVDYATSQFRSKDSLEVSFSSASSPLGFDVAGLDSLLS